MLSKNINKSEAKFIIRELNVSDVDASFDLLNSVAEEMKNAGHEEYIISKPKQKIAANILDDNNQMAGIFLLDEFGNESQLVAEMGYFGIPEDSLRNEDGDFLPNFNASAIKNSEIDYIGSVCVDPNFRGLGLFKDMDKFLNDNSKRRFSIATVEVTNYKSFGHFLDSGFMLTETTIDPYDDANIFYLVKDKTNKISLSPKGKAIIPVSLKNKNYKEQIEEVKGVNSLVGAAFHKESQSILFCLGIDPLTKLGVLKETAQPKFNKKKQQGVYSAPIAS